MEPRGNHEMDWIARSHTNRAVSIHCRAVAQLPVSICPPTPNSARFVARARVSWSRDHEVGHREVRDSSRLLGRHRRAVAELSVGVAAPADERAFTIESHGASVVLRDRCETDRNSDQPRNYGWRTGTPAEYGSVRERRRIANLNAHPSCRHMENEQPIGRHPWYQRRDRAIGLRAIAELAVAVVAPASQHPRGRDDARVVS